MILVTGGTGFVGHHVVHALRARELPVRALVRDRRRARTLEGWGCELVDGDVADATSLERAVAGCEAIVHLVAIRQGRREQFERVMTAATRDLVSAARQTGVRRLVLMSALGVDEATKDLVPYYGAKWEMERIVEGSGLEWVTFRPSFVFGRDGGILPTFARLARLAPVTPIPGAGTQRIQPIWVEDVGAFFAKAVDLPAAANRIWELGGPEPVSWNEFWTRLKRTLAVRRPSWNVPMPLMRLNALVTERLPGDIPLTRDLLKMLEAGDNTCDVAPAREAFDQPLVPLDEQLRRATTR
jgi:NADH dehydrogenase